MSTRHQSTLSSDQGPPCAARRRARWTTSVAAVLLVVIGLVTPAGAQIQFRGFQDRHDRVQREIERTSELWKEVNARATQSNLPGARALVDQARLVQRRAVDALQQAASAGLPGDDGLSNERIANQHLQTSLTLTLRARDLTTRAARQLREDLSQEENARRTIERARQQLERGGAGDERLRAQAAQLLDQAELQWRDGRFEQALRLAQNAVTVLETIGEHEADDPDPARVEEALRRTRERYERAVVAGAPAKALQVVDRLLDQAHQSLREGSPREAAQRIMTARRTLEDLERGARDDGNRTERALERLDIQIERIHDRFGDELDGSGQRLLRQAAQARDRARRALQEGDEAQAQQQIRAAADLLARLQRQLGGRG